MHALIAQNVALTDDRDLALLAGIAELSERLSAVEGCVLAQQFGCDRPSSWARLGRYLFGLLDGRTQ